MRHIIVLNKSLNLLKIKNKKTTTSVFNIFNNFYKHAIKLPLISSFIFFKAGLDATVLFYNLGQMMELEIDVPIWIMFLSFPVGFIIMGLFSLELLLQTLNEIYEDRST